jgi:hypothetical protein
MHLAELSNPSAFPELGTLFVRYSSNSVWTMYTYDPEGSYAGFGYPLYEISSPFLGGLFQPPTLLGFSLQSFAPFR